MAQGLSTEPYVQQTPHAEGTGFSFTIARLSNDVAIGHCGLWLKELDEGRASAGYAVIPSMRNHGYGADALMVLTEFAWTVPGLHRIELLIEAWNTASLQTAERAGYREEGVLASYQMIGGEPRDMVLYASARPNFGSLLRPEPPENFVGFGRPVLAGNHVMIRCEEGVVALSHVQQGSAHVRLGHRREIYRR